MVRTSSDLPMERAPHPPPEHLQGIVERVTYHAEDSGYTVARLKAPGVRDLVTIVGRFPDIHAGQSLHLAGYRREHAKYGQKSGPFSADSRSHLVLHVVDIPAKKP